MEKRPLSYFTKNLDNLAADDSESDESNESDKS